MWLQVNCEVFDLLCCGCNVFTNVALVLFVSCRRANMQTILLIISKVKKNTATNKHGCKQCPIWNKKQKKTLQTCFLVLKDTLQENATGQLQMFLPKNSHNDVHLLDFSKAFKQIYIHLCRGTSPRSDPHMKGNQCCTHRVMATHVHTMPEIQNTIVLDNGQVYS